MQCLETRYDVELSTSHPIVRLAIRHAAWLWERFQPGEDGLNGYQRNHQSAMLPFAEIVMWRDPGPHMLKLRSKWGHGVRLGRSVASDSRVIGTRLGSFLVRGVRRLPPSARHQVHVLLSMRETPSRMAHGRPAEPRSAVEPPAEPSGSRNVEAGSRTNVEETVPQTTQATPSGKVDAQTTTPNVPMHQATSSSSAIVPSGGEHTKRSADPTVEGEIPMSEVKRPRGRPITRILPMPGTMEYTEGCPGCRGDGHHHKAQCKRRAAERAVSASHVRGAASRVRGTEVFQIKFKLRLTRESKPRRGPQQFMWELPEEGHSCSFLRPRVTPKGLRVLRCDGSVSGLCFGVCVSSQLVSTLLVP